MPDVRRLSILACTLVVLLRMSIGWQFLYEGLWKIDSLDTSDPWTAEGYLKNARGPFRDVFRSLTGDPDDLSWLDYDSVSGRWGAWQQRFVQHYRLSEQQQRRLNEIVNGPEDYRAVLKELPEGVEFRGSLGKAIRFDAGRERLIVPGDWHLLPSERDRLLAMVEIKDNPETDQEREANKRARLFQEAVKKVFARSSRLSYKEQLAASLKGDPERAGVVLAEHKGTIDYKTPGDIELYREQLQRYKEHLANAEQDFQFDHLDQLGLPGRGDVREFRNSLVGPIKSLEADLKAEARKLLTQDQLMMGAVPEPMTAMRRIDLMTMWSLTILGGLLIVGLFSRVSAIGAAGLLLSFYLAVPPWPGVPEAPGPEHSLIINKNLIEVVALLAVAAMPTGRWFGIDAMVRRFILRRPTD